MVLFNYSTRELTAKIVYYGPGLCGKTTNLQYIHSTLPDNVRGKMLSLATKTDRTLFFDFLPIDLGQIRGMKTRVQLYTVPGQVFYNETRKLVLKGADGIVFVADSQATMLGANIESFKNLEENLKAHGMNLAEMPHVLQFNKRDLPKLSGIEELNAAINRFNAPFYESVATTGIGVQDTLKAITKLVLLHLTRKYDPKATAPAASASTVSASVRGAPPMEPETPAAAPPAPLPSPSATMQMPAIGQSASGAGAIPLSNSAVHPADPPPGFDGGASIDIGGDLTGEMSFDDPGLDVSDRTPAADEPAFGDQEIQDLVDEVQETAGSVEASFEDPGIPPAWEEASPDPVAPVDSGFSADPLVPLADPVADDDPFGADPVGPVEPPAVRPDGVATESADDAQPAFEIDRGMDPEWGPLGRPPVSEPVADPTVTAAETESESPSLASNQPWDLGSIDAPEGLPDPAGPGAALDLPRLTEVVADDELFDANALDVARLAEGEEREIVVPVEVEHSDRSTRRYKLSIRLRLDPVR